MNKVTIDRELLEQVASEFEHNNDRYMLGRELRKILDAPRQPEGDHGWLVSLELPDVQCNCAWNPDSHDKTCPVYLRDRLSDAQRAIAELREVNRIQLEIASVHGAACVEIRKERDTLRHQRDKLAGLLREVIPDYSAPQGKGHLYAEVDAALAEVKPCPESPAPTT